MRSGLPNGYYATLHATSPCRLQLHLVLTSRLLHLNMPHCLIRSLKLKELLVPLLRLSVNYSGFGLVLLFFVFVFVFVFCFLFFVFFLLNDGGLWYWKWLKKGLKGVTNSSGGKTYVWRLSSQNIIVKKLSIGTCTGVNKNQKWDPFYYVISREILH